MPTKLSEKQTNLIDQAIEMYASVGGNFHVTFSHYLRNHYVYVSPRCLILAQLHEKHWFIELAIGKGCLRRFIELMPVYRPKIAWARDLKNKPIKYHKTDRLLRLI